jgi:KDO2-lipid IV(A) lauroyltransferase
VTNPVARVADGLTSGSFAGAWALVRGLPEPVARRLFDAGAELAAVRGGKGVERLREVKRQAAVPSEAA